MKRFIACFLCIITAISVFTSCSSDNNSIEQSVDGQDVPVSNMSKNIIVNRYSWGMSMDECKRISFDLDVPDGFIDNPDTLFYDISKIDYIFTNESVKNGSTPLLRLDFKNDKLNYICFASTLYANSTDRNNPLFSSIENELSEEFGELYYQSDSDSSIRNIYYKDGTEVLLSTDNVFIVSFNYHDIGKKPTDMNQKIYEYGITALKFVDDYLNEKIDNQIVIQKLKTYEDEIEKIYNSNNDIDYCNSSVKDYIFLIYLKIDNLNSDYGSGTIFDVVKYRNILALLINEPPIRYKYKSE